MLDLNGNTSSVQIKKKKLPLSLESCALVLYLMI